VENISDKVLILSKLKGRSQDVVRLAMVMRHARSLPEWSDAQDAMANILEACGDDHDQASPEDLGFVNDRRSVQPKAELLARGDRLLAELHHFCGTSRAFGASLCDCPDCQEVRNFNLDDVL
jgi:hypothetical protein